jgi:general transcription factor 3C polypeptide 4
VIAIRRFYHLLILIQRVLVICKPGKVQLTTLDPAASSWTGIYTLSLAAQDITSDSSAFYPISGIEYIPHEDTVVLSAFDGSFYVIRNLSTAPEVAHSQISGFLATEGLTLQARASFVRVETQDAKSSVAITREDVNRISGMTAYDGASTLTWIHE